MLNLYSRPLRRLFFSAVLSWLCLVSAGSPLAQHSGPTLLTLTVGVHQIKVELAETIGQLQTGLMHRQSMPAHHGMLFDFGTAQRVCMWMKNTPLLLSVAFVRDDGIIVNIDDMKPQTLDSHCSTNPVRWALETNQGWFASKGLAAGDRINGIPQR